MNLPNILTLSRVGFLALVVYLMAQPWPGAASLALICFIVAAVTDWLDGYIARKYNLITNFGKIMDALVDKVMVLGAFFALALFEILPLWSWPLIVLMTLREVGITVLRFVAAKKGIVLAAEKTGKRKTIWQIVAICVLLFIPVTQVDVPAWFGAPPWWFADFFYWSGLIYFLYASILTVVSGTLYLRRYVPVLRNA